MICYQNILQQLVTNIGQEVQFTEKYSNNYLSAWADIFVYQTALIFWFLLSKLFSKKAKKKKKKKKTSKSGVKSQDRVLWTGP